MHSNVQTLAVGAAVLSALVDCSPIHNTIAPFSLQGRNLVKRGVTEVICGIYPSVDVYDDLGTGGRLADKGDQNVLVAANSCNRVGYWDTSGVYVCNDQSVDLNVPMSKVVELHNYMQKICLASPDGSDSQENGSGRVTTDEYGGFNVNIGYANVGSING
ncbi:hypothetical protein LTR37_007052 [Vermiconidia calcicola]|uniref:Uncharacterized protein n=1 Tax=Vermiconidia calcicola TaxID=1690605 RepID=A0ACC3NEL6_9PEZI|nr:hypothetical protein LTR37_007052 [Vermiconidia calcicola]